MRYNEISMTIMYDAGLLSIVMRIVIGIVNQP